MIKICVTLKVNLIYVGMLQNKKFTRFFLFKLPKYQNVFNKNERIFKKYIFKSIKIYDNFLHKK